jgi:hypothetical protein
MLRIANNSPAQLLSPRGSSPLPLSPRELHYSDVPRNKKNVPRNKKHLFGGWFVSLKPGRAQLNARIVKVFFDGCDVRRVVLARLTMTALVGLAPFLELSNNHFGQQRAMLVDKIGEKKADPRNRTNAHMITSNDSNQQSKASRQAHTNELTSAH